MPAKALIKMLCLAKRLIEVNSRDASGRTRQHPVLFCQHNCRPVKGLCDRGSRQANNSLLPSLPRDKQDARICQANALSHLLYGLLRNALLQILASAVDAA